MEQQTTDVDYNVVVVVATFFNNNFVNCKATLILEIKNVPNKIQYTAIMK